MRLITLSSLSRYYLHTFCYVLLLAIAYIHTVSPYFSYAGFSYDFSATKAFEAFLTISLFALWTPKFLRKPSDFYLNFSFFLVYIPFALLYCLSGLDRHTFYIVSVGIALTYLILAFLPNLALSKPVKLSLPPVIGFFALALGVGTLCLVFLAGTLSFNYSLIDVYKYREESSNMINVGFFSYLNVWCSKVFLPSLVAFSVWFKKHWLTLFLCLLSVLLFGVVQHKAILFYPYIVIAVLLLFRKQQNLWIFPFVLSLVVLAALVVHSISGNILISSLLVRRTLFVPAFLTYKYHEFFSSNDLVWWSNSFMRGFIDYPYEVGTARLIGQFLGGESNANNNYLATGFMHAGYIGLYTYCIFVALFLRLIDSITLHRLPVVLVVALTLVPLNALLKGADLTTAITTHGLALSILLIYLLRSSSTTKSLSRD